jgi:Carboxymuconolactone decarboxylase family
MPDRRKFLVAWVGTAMYAAFAVGAPAGTTLYAGYGFAAIALATTLIPLLTLLLVAPRRPVAPVPHVRPAFATVIGAVWVPGLGLALSSVGFGAITTFIVLLFAQHGWGQAWLAFTVLSITFMAGRLIFGHLPDRIGGARVALVCVLIEAAGQALIWLAPWSALALFGAAVTGFGYSLVYPGLREQRKFLRSSRISRFTPAGRMPCRQLRAMDNGLTKSEASEMLTHLLFYAGWPNVFSAISVVKGVFEKRPR